METTTNYKLPQWVKADQIKMDDFNGAFANIDAALKAEGDARSEADGTAAERITALAQTIANGKLCRIKYGSYVGNGKYGAANPVEINCDFYPVLVIVLAADTVNSNRGVGVRGCTALYNPIGRVNTLSWTDNTVSWYYPTSDSGYSPAGNQYNSNGVEYLYLVLGYSSENE